MNVDKEVLNCLPKGIQNKLSEYECINEIRLRENSPLGVTCGNKNYISNYVVTKKDIEFVVINLCEKSVHTYYEYIKQGYIPFKCGYRIGVCGKAVLEGDSITNISDIKSINIRVPHENVFIPDSLLENISAEKGIMVYSPPNHGKTTFLKALIKNLASPPKNKRISVIDSKFELYSEELHADLPVDFFSGYPKYTAIDMAVRNMSPEIIVCDEIGLLDDISPIVECKNSGVNVICSAHARTFEELILRKNIKILHNLGVFNGYVGISIKNGNRLYEYKKRKDIL